MNASRILLVLSVLLSVAAAAILFEWFGIDPSHFGDGLGLGFLGLACLSGSKLV